MEVFLRAKIMSMALDLASAVTMRLQPAGSPLGPSAYFTRTHRVLTAPLAGLATRRSDFATNRHESCGLGIRHGRSHNEDVIAIGLLLSTT